MEANHKKRILAIVGSASEDSSNHRLVGYLKSLLTDDFDFTVFHNLKTLPHFDPELSTNNPSAAVVAFREAVAVADGVIICTPEYIFSVPSGLKNAIEWCVATTVFSEKPIGIITASAHGQAGHEELQRIMKTLMAKITEETTLLISGIKGKISADGTIISVDTRLEIERFAKAFRIMVA